MDTPYKTELISDIIYRRQRKSNKFCTMDFKIDADKELVKITKELSNLLHDRDITIRYENVVDLDPKSEEFNPNGEIGCFIISEIATKSEIPK